MIHKVDQQISLKKYKKPAMWSIKLNWYFPISSLAYLSCIFTLQDSNNTGTPLIPSSIRTPSSSSSSSHQTRRERLTINLDIDLPGMRPSVSASSSAEKLPINDPASTGRGGGVPSSSSLFHHGKFRGFNRRGWMIVLAGFILDIPFMGMVMSFGELLLPLLDTFGGGTATISKWHCPWQYYHGCSPVLQRVLRL